MIDATVRAVQTSAARAVRKITRPSRPADIETWPLFQAFYQDRSRGERKPLVEGGHFQ